MAKSTPKTTKKTSRLLAALDAPDEPLAPMQLNGLGSLGGVKRTNSNGSQEDLIMRAAGSHWSQKKRATGLSRSDTLILSDGPSSPTYKGTIRFKELKQQSSAIVPYFR